MPEGDQASGYQPWFKRNPGWYQDAKASLEARGFVLDEKLFREEQRVEFKGHSQVEPTRELRLVFPDGFPSNAPKMFDTDASEPLSMHHNALSRQLCLFGVHENRWNATLDPATAIDEAEELIKSFPPAQTAPASENMPEPLTRLQNYLEGSAVLIPPPISSFTDFAGLKDKSGKFEIRWKAEGEAKSLIGRGIVTEAYFGNTIVPLDSSYSSYAGGAQKYGQWFYLPGNPTIRDIQPFLAECLKKCRVTRKADEYWIGVIFDEQSQTRQNTRKAWMIFRVVLNKDGSWRSFPIRSFPHQEEDRLARIPGYGGLLSRKVTVIGCGSLGSKIAVNLAASGVNDFRLVEFDYYEPGNSVRHELGVNQFGRQKAEALLERLCEINPSVRKKSVSLHFKVGSISKFEEEQKFFEMIRVSDLVIDATGMHGVSHFLNETCCEVKTPCLYVGVTNGAWGGEVVRTIPSRTACWLCWKEQYYDNSPPSAPREAGEVFPPGCDQPTFTGATHELGYVASLACTVAIDTLLGEESILPLSGDYLRYSLRDEKEFLFKTEILKVAKNPECQRCG